MRKWLSNLLLGMISMIPLSPNAFGQHLSSDYQLLQRQLSPSDYTISQPKRSVPKGIPIPLGAAMWVYQNLISPHLTSTCLYHPSCSSYSVELLRRYGTLAGMVMTADRLTRCNRLVLHDISIHQINPASGKVGETTDYYQWRKPQGK